MKYLDSEIATAVGWSPGNELLSCSDDKIVCKWGADGEPTGKITTLNVYASSLSWFPTSGKQVCYGVDGLFVRSIFTKSDYLISVCWNHAI